MKISIYSTALLLLLNSAHGATVNAFWSFQDTKAGTGNFTTVVTAETFNGVPTVAQAGTQISPLGTGGADSFTSYEGGTAWLGSGNVATPGTSLVFDPGSGGNTMSFAFDLTNTFDLMMRADIRSAQGTGATRSTAFSAIEYSVGGVGFISTGSALSLGFAANNNFQQYTLDLSTLSAIENQSDVVIRFTVPNQSSGPNTSFRVDNVQFSADMVPEPSAAVLTLTSLAGFLLRRRR